MVAMAALGMRLRTVGEPEDCPAFVASRETLDQRLELFGRYGPDGAR